ncbi:MAG: dimethyl sulfoxide reductase anchor subunit family protein [Arachnia sp.]
MELTQLPMVIFTVFAQMSVGAFLVLGVIQTFGSIRHSSATVDRLADPALYAIGPTLVLGLIASMFHMHDVTNVLNVVRHVGSSWLSREILMGTGFAGLGFLFAASQWFKWGSPRFRQILAAVTALVGVGLVYVMSMIYYSLKAVPSWNTWFTPVQFGLTTVLLGSLAVGAAMLTAIMFKRHTLERGGKIFGAKTDAEASDGVAITDLLSSSLKGIALTAIITGGLLLVLLPLHLSQLAALGPAGEVPLQAYSGAGLVVRLSLVVIGTGLLGVFTYLLAGRGRNPRPLAVVATLAFALVLVAEFMGRTQFYESMMRIGI